MFGEPVGWRSTSAVWMLAFGPRRYGRLPTMGVRRLAAQVARRLRRGAPRLASLILLTFAAVTPAAARPAENGCIPMVDSVSGRPTARHWHGAAVQSRYSYQVWPRPPTFAKLLSRNYFPLPFLTRAFASFT